MSTADKIVNAHSSDDDSYAIGVDYGTLCEAILAGASLQSHIPRGTPAAKPASPTKNTAAKPKERGLRLVKKSASA